VGVTLGVPVFTVVFVNVTVALLLGVLVTVSVVVTLGVPVFTIIFVSVTVAL
jgi:hypothetical protein